MVDTLEGRKADVKIQTLDETLVEVEANAPVDTLLESR